jgi:hypothetical protein
MILLTENLLSSKEYWQFIYEEILEPPSNKRYEKKKEKERQ